nr:hypothetical protein [Saccharothrix deserti]
MTADELHGHDTKFRLWLETVDVPHVVAVPKNAMVVSFELLKFCVHRLIAELPEPEDEDLRGATENRDPPRSSTLFTNVPPQAATRSSMPSRPNPFPPAGPQPSSTTSTPNARSCHRNRTRTDRADACRAALVSDSWTIRYTVMSTSDETGRGSPTTSSDRLAD